MWRHVACAPPGPPFRKKKEGRKDRSSDSTRCLGSGLRSAQSPLKAQPVPDASGSHSEILPLTFRFVSAILSAVMPKATPGVCPPQLQRHRFTKDTVNLPEFKAKVRDGIQKAKARRHASIRIVTFEGAPAIELPPLSGPATLKNLCQRATPATIVETIKLMRTAKDEKVRLEAARLILNYAEGLPEQPLKNGGRAGDGSGPINVIIGSPSRGQPVVTSVSPDSRTITVSAPNDPSSFVPSDLRGGEEESRGGEEE